MLTFRGDVCFHTSPRLGVSPPRSHARDAGAGEALGMGLVNEIDELRVYRVIQTCQLRNAPNVSEGSRIKDAPDFTVGDLFAVCHVKPSALEGSDNGPYLSLSNAYGWLFERKHNSAMSVRMPLERGLFAYKVSNKGVGLALRAHPTNRDEPELKFGYSHGLSAEETALGQVLYPHDHVVWGDARVTFEGVTYVRVQGTTGWLFSRRGENNVLVECVDADEVKRLSNPNGVGENQLALVDVRSDAIAIAGNAPGYAVHVPNEVVPEMLPLRDLRAMAKRHGLRESFFNQTSWVVSFVKDLGAGETGRVDVYYTTGTIGVTLRHHRELVRTQGFYPRCGIREVELLFKNPRDANVRGGYKRRRQHDGPFGNGNAVRTMGVYVKNSSDTYADDEEMKLRGELRGLDGAMDDLRKQRESLVSLLRETEGSSRRGALLRMRRENEMREAAAKELAVQSKGSRWTIVNAMRDSHPALVQSLEANFTNVEHVALTERAFFVSRANGRCLFRGIHPDRAEEYFIGSIGSSGNTVPYYAMASDGRHFARHCSGASSWNGGDDDERFSELCADPNRAVARVAFGDPGSWFIVFENGRWEAKGVPDRMVDFVHANGSSPTEVSLGEDDTYFVRMTNGEFDFSLPRSCATVCRELANKGHALTNVALSPTNTTFGWLIRYE